MKFLITRSVLLALFLMAAAGCTVVQVEGASPASAIAFGAVRLEAPDSPGWIAYRSRGLGLVPGIGGTTLGAATESAVLVFRPEECRVVIFEMDDVQRERLRNIIDDIAEGEQSICTIKGVK